MTPVRGTARKAGMVTSSLTGAKGNTSSADIDFGADLVDAGLVDGAGAVAGAAMGAVAREVVAGAVAVGEAAAAGGHTEAAGALGPRGAGNAARLAIRDRLDTGAAAAQAVGEASGLVQAVAARPAFGVARANQRTRLLAGGEEQEKREKSHRARVSPLVARQAHALGEGGREQIADVLQPLRNGAEIERARIEPRLHLAPAERRRHRRSRRAAQRVRGDDGLPVRVLHAVEVEPPAARRERSLQRHVRELLDHRLADLHRERLGVLVGVASG